MLISKIFYLILMIVSVVFFILYTGPLSLYLMIFIFLIPIVPALCILLARFLVTAEVRAESETAVKNDKIAVSVNIRNRLPIPFSSSTVSLEYSNTLVNIKERTSITIPIQRMCRQKVEFSLVSDYCGILTVKLRSVRLYDFIKLFSCRIKPKKNCVITVLPEIYTINPGNGFRMINSDDSDIFSKHRPGDDPSEIFALKDYVPGDKPNRIHWNLSLKHEQLIVRHYSQPIGSSILLLLDFCGAPGKDAKILDTAADTAFSLALFLTENDIPFNFTFFGGSSKKDISFRVTDEKDTAQVMRTLFTEGPSESSELPKIISGLTRDYSAVFYITTSADNLVSVIKNIPPEGFRPVFIDGGKSQNPFAKSKEVAVIPAGNAEHFVSTILTG